MIPRPAITGSPHWAFPLPRVSRLDNGMTVWAYHLPGQMIVSCDLVLELPLNAEPPGRQGVATLAVRCLDEGTRSHPGPGFSAALEGVGAEFSGMVGLSTTQAMLDVPYDSLDDALLLFAEAVTSPDYQPADVERIKANRLAEIDQQESRGSYVAASALRCSLLADHLRIGQPVGGTSDQVSQIGPDDVTLFHHTQYHPRSSTLIIAGDLDPDQAVSSAERAFGHWTTSGVPSTAETISRGIPRRQVIDRTGAVQADVRFGWYGIDRRDPAWPALQVALAIMGGSFNSRLNSVLREEKGYTYGVSMSAHPYRVGGIVEFAASTRTETAPDLIAEARRIIQADTPFSADEVNQAIGYLTLSAPLSLDTAEAVTSQAASLAAARLDLDHVTRSLDDLARVTPAQALAAYRHVVDPDQTSIAVVADTTVMGDLGLA